MRRSIITVLLLACICFTIQSQSENENENEDEMIIETYSLGDQVLTINLGPIIPLFFQALDGSVEPTNLTLGGGGSIHWGSFVNNRWTIGLEAGGMFAFSPNNRTLFMLPVTGKLSYYLRSFPFEIPLSLGIGMNMTRLSGNFHVEPIVKPAVSVFWKYNAEWSFGANFVYWWIPQIYLINPPPKDHSRFGNFLEVTLSALYHF
ncbi:MAG: TP0733 family outer membrane beta-barrel protein [Spirochaetia bacterium]